MDSNQFAIGRNQETLNLVKQLKIEAILDDSAKEGETWKKIPVIRPCQLPERPNIINCASSISPTSVGKRIAELRPLASITTYYEMHSEYPSMFPVPGFVQEMLVDYQENHAKWQWLENLLGDESSTQTFHDLVNFRRTGNTRHLSNYSVRLAEQYFDKIVAFHAGEVFIDCGGFDGDTTYQFIKKCDDYKRVWLFEPSEANMQKAKRRLVGIRDINYVSKGLSDAPGTVSFNSEAGSASAVSESGGNTIVVTTIDNEINDPVTFIKMDLEGWELKALNGSRSHIERNHPKLAIAVYHSASDFWKIPEFVLGICKDYQIYLRHYTEGWSETVMYFIPE